jgi:uncharacterized membrane protein
MKIKFNSLPIETLLRLNMISIIVICFCEAFAVSVLLIKGLAPGTERWRFFVYLTVVIVIALSLLASIGLSIYFLKLKKKSERLKDQQK